MAKKTRSIITGSAIAAVVLLLLVMALRTPPVPVDIATVEIGTLLVTVRGEGRTRIKDIYSVSAPVAGRLSRIEVHPGDAVEGGSTVVASIEPSIPSFLDTRTQAQAEAGLRVTEAQKSLATAALEKAEAEHAYAVAELERAQGLNVGEAISRRRLDDAERMVKTRAADVVIAGASLKAAEFQLAAARAALIGPDEAGTSGGADCCITLAAPITGRILRVNDESARLVAAGEPLMDVGDPTSLEIVVDLLSTDAVRVRHDARAIIENWGGDQDLEAIVRLVEPSGFTKISALGIEEQRVNAILDFAGQAGPLLLGDGYRVEVRIVVNEAENVLLVPIGALFRAGTDWAVYRNDDGAARLAMVDVGSRNGTFAQIRSGLSEGDEIIQHPPDSLADGARITIRPK